MKINTVEGKYWPSGKSTGSAFLSQREYITPGLEVLRSGLMKLSGSELVVVVHVGIASICQVVFSQLSLAQELIK